jgi:Transcription factor WhiB
MLRVADRQPVAYGDARIDLMSLLTPPAWHADALCKEYSTLDWVPSNGADQSATKAVCARCSVRAECLAAAIDGLEQGIWGGTNSRERTAIRRAAA